MSDLTKFSGPNFGYVVEQYEMYLKDPNSVAPEYRALFANRTPELEEKTSARTVGRDSASREKVEVRVFDDQDLRLLGLVEAVRHYGHLNASIDPLDLRKKDASLIADSSRKITEAEMKGLPADMVPSPLAKGAASAAEVVSRLKSVYCGTTGYEYGHIRSSEERFWLQSAFESGQYRANLDPQAKLSQLEQLTQAEVFEQFLHSSFPGQKWFSLEGNEALIPILDDIVFSAAHSDLRALHMGMAHRGRLNVLAHILDKPYEKIMSGFLDKHFVQEGRIEDVEIGRMRDVKYHLGAKNRVPTPSHGEIFLQLSPNPSHLEMVGPVVLGAVRSRHEKNGNVGLPHLNPDAAMGIIMHGDAAFAGQGIVAETFNLAGLEGYRIGGSIHIIINNQVGFTTEPSQTQSTIYCSDMARGYDLPIVHVNADDVEACISAARLAFAYRQKFHKDFVIDLVGYRRFGHNEGDEPTFTQPVMYEAIRTHPTVKALWAERLVKEGVATQEKVEALAAEMKSRLQSALDAVREAKTDDHASPSAHVNGVEPAQPPAAQPTAVPADELAAINKEINTFPEGFALNPKLDRPFQRRREALDGAAKIDWAHGEALSFASILADGTPIRMTGQDIERGTFSQRHAVLHDVKTDARLVPLQTFPSTNATFAIHNSPLSEASVLAYEYGYSVSSPETLVLWEAQFGDFVNNAQSVIDEFISSAHAKWGKQSSIVMLLPHGYEGQGPDHSSAFLERFLQVAAEDNIQVAYPTNASQYFHLLRRQAKSLGGERRPLVVMTAKSLLRHPMAQSSITDLAEGHFQTVIDDARARESIEKVRRIVLCTGKVYVDMITSEEYQKASNVAIVRIEGLYPFPAERLGQVLSQYAKAKEVLWTQEEPENRGAAPSVMPRIFPLLKHGVSLRYVGRPARASHAEGSSGDHKNEQARIIREALLDAGLITTSAGMVKHVR